MEIGNWRASSVACQGAFRPSDGFAANWQSCVFISLVASNRISSTSLDSNATFKLDHRSHRLPTLDFPISIFQFPCFEPVSDSGIGFIPITLWMNPSRPDSKRLLGLMFCHNGTYNWVLPKNFIESKSLSGIIPDFGDRGYTLGFILGLALGFVPELALFTFNNLAALDVFDIAFWIPGSAEMTAPGRPYTPGEGSWVS